MYTVLSWLLLIHNILSLHLLVLRPSSKLDSACREVLSWILFLHKLFPLLVLIFMGAS